VEAGPTQDVGDEDDDEGEDKVAEELRAKIAEMEGQVSQVWNPGLKSRMGVILEGLRTQLKEREGEVGDGESTAGEAQLTPEDSENGDGDESEIEGENEEDQEDLKAHD
jgi:hypothetical protein